MKKVTILGAGAYSIALSKILDKNGAEVTLWTKFAAERELLERERGNEGLLPDVKLSENTDVSDDLERSTQGCDVIIIAVPSDAVRSVTQELKPFYAGQILCIATKGIEQNTGYFMDQVVAEELPAARICALSGPSCASEIANFLPTAVTVAGAKELTSVINEYFHNDRFKIEETTDIRGTLVCGALKNILAIGAGILMALEAGDNALATLITNGLKEIGAFQEALGGEKSTSYLSCGVGDVVTTCAGAMSRNKKLGVLIGEGKTAAEANEIQRKTVEGFTALDGAQKLIRENQLDLPIIQAICNIALNNDDLKSLINAVCK